MMKIAIQEEAVYHNIELFMDLLERVERVRQAQVRPRVKVYTAVVNRATGDLIFTERSPKELKDKNWKAIRLRVMIAEEERGQPIFEVLEEGDESFKTSDLQPLASRILSETVRVLNTVSKRIRGVADIEEVLDEISHLEIEREKERAVISDIIHEAWHQVDRVGAEFLLQQQIPGTFFFRKDDYASILEEQLQMRFGPEVKCITLTCLGPAGKVSDYTLVKRPQGWLIYDDDPKLEGQTFSSVQELIENMDENLQTPLLH